MKICFRIKIWPFYWPLYIIGERQGYKYVIVLFVWPIDYSTLFQTCPYSGKLFFVWSFLDDWTVNYYTLYILYSSIIFNQKSLFHKCILYKRYIDAYVYRLILKHLLAWKLNDFLFYQTKIVIYVRTINMRLNNILYVN